MPNIINAFGQLMMYLDIYGIFRKQVSKDYFHKAMRCIVDEKQKELLDGFNNPETKISYEFAMIHHQRVKRSLMPPDRKKTS